MRPLLIGMKINAGIKTKQTDDIILYSHVLLLWTLVAACSSLATTWKLWHNYSAAHLIIFSLLNVI